MKDDAADDLE